MESLNQSFDGAGRRQKLHLSHQMKRSSGAQPYLVMQLHGVLEVCRQSVI